MLTKSYYLITNFFIKKGILKLITYYIIAGIIILMDQFTKYLTINTINLGEIINVLPGFLSFTYIQNTGAAWSILEGQMIFFYIITIIVVGLLLYFLHNDAKGSPLLSTAIAFMIGGAIGNFIDRIVFKYVIDMIRLEFITFPIFNVADMALTVGVILLIIGVIFEEFILKKEG